MRFAALTVGRKKREEEGEGLVFLGGVSLLFQRCCCFSPGSKQAQEDVYGCVGKLFLLQSSGFAVFFPHSRFVLTHVLAEVVVCAVGWVETLPAMEMTAQATALLVLVPSLHGGKMGRKKTQCPTPTAA